MELDKIVKKINTLIKIKERQKINKFFIFIEGITGSGKTFFSKILKNKIQTEKKIYLIYRDVFLRSRIERIKITEKINDKVYINQNELHYDQKKIDRFVKIVSSSSYKKYQFKSMYNRKNGKNNLKINFKFSPNSIIIIEGLYSSFDFKFKDIECIKILLETSVYKSLSVKIKRIRDKKISIYSVIKEFINIHLHSFAKYLHKQKFDLFIKYQNKDYFIVNNSQKKQISQIYKFINQHK